VGWIPTSTPQGGPTNIIGDSGDNFWNDYSINGKISWDIAEGHKVTFSTLASYYNYGYNNYHSYLRPLRNADLLVQEIKSQHPGGDADSGR